MALLFLEGPSPCYDSLVPPLKAEHGPPPAGIPHLTPPPPRPPQLAGPQLFSPSVWPALVSFDSFAAPLSVFVSHSVDSELCGVTGQVLNTLLFSEASCVWDVVNSHKKMVGLDCSDWKQRPEGPHFLKDL